MAARAPAARLRRLGGRSVATIEAFGSITRFGGNIVTATLRPPFRARSLVREFAANAPLANRGVKRALARSAAATLEDQPRRVSRLWA